MNKPELGLWLGWSSQSRTAFDKPPQLTIVQNDVRTLKIEATGDFFHGNIKPKIRLCGHWLERAGFKPGTRVQVTLLRPGAIHLQSIEAPESEAKEEA